MPNPTQPARFFEGLSTGPEFAREYEFQDSIPIDGSNADVRSLSPFVMRVLPPLILGDRLNTIPVRPAQSFGDEPTRQRVDYAGAIRDLYRSSPSTDTYDQIVRRGEAIPGLTQASVQDLERYVANQARNQQLAGNRALQAVNRQRREENRSRVAPALANDTSALSILLQLKRMMAIPPLMMLINPSSLSVSYTKIAQLQERTRYGYIYQSWGEELAKVSFSCTVGAFIAGRANPTQTGVPSGMQFAAKRDSAAFQQLMAVLSLYQSSGYIQDTAASATGRRSKAFQMVGNTAIEYDQWVYVGHMDSFTYSYEETNQNGGIKFDIEFTAIRVFDMSSPKVSVTPLANPQGGTGRVPNNQSPDSRLSRTFRGEGGSQLFTAPTVGGQVPPQPWSGQAVSVDTQTGDVITTRRGRV